AEYLRVGVAVRWEYLRRFHLLKESEDSTLEGEVGHAHRTTRFHCAHQDVVRLAAVYLLGQFEGVPHACIPYHADEEVGGSLALARGGPPIPATAKRQLRLGEGIQGDDGGVVILDDSAIGDALVPLPVARLVLTKYSSVGQHPTDVGAGPALPGQGR